MRIRNINEYYGEDVEFDSVEEMEEALKNLFGDGVDHNPDEGLKEGVDYEIIEEEGE